MSGRVLAVTTNAGVAGATVLFDPSETFNGSMLVPSSAAIRTVTDASGFYTVAVPAGVTGTVAPLFLVPVDVGSRFRVEPEVGYTRTTNEQTIQTTPPTLPVPIPVPIVTNTTSKQVTAVPSIGTGVFFAQSREKIRLHYGARFGYARTSSDFTSVSRTTTAATSTTNMATKQTGYFVGPALGGEYFLGESSTATEVARLHATTFWRRALKRVALGG